MKKALFFMFIVLTAGFRGPGGGDLTRAERKFAIDYLQQTRSRVPEGNFPNTAAAIQAFIGRRDSTIAYLTSTQDDLKTHFIEHPQWGTLDCYQGFVMLSAHCARHTLQLEEVMANPNFPKQ